VGEYSVLRKKRGEPGGGCPGESNQRRGVEDEKQNQLGVQELPIDREANGHKKRGQGFLGEKCRPLSDR